MSSDIPAESEPNKYWVSATKTGISSVQAVLYVASAILVSASYLGMGWVNKVRIGNFGPKEIAIGGVSVALFLAAIVQPLSDYNDAPTDAKHLSDVIVPVIGLVAFVGVSIAYGVSVWT